VFSLLLSGCPNKSGDLVPEENRIKALSLLYGQYTGQHRGQTPADEKEFKQFVASRKETLESFQLDPNNIDQLFVSPRDSQPYGIAYKVKTSGIPDPMAPSPPVIWEKVGSAGKHYVADSLGKVELISEDEFKKRVPNPG
jgi:hypothetical protein